MIKRFLSVIALSVALGLSTMGFKNAENDVAENCEATSDLTVTANLDNMDVGAGEIHGRIVNQSDDNDYDDVMVRVEFHGAELNYDDDLGDAELDRERDLDVDVDENDVDVDLETTPEMDADVDEMDADVDETDADVDDTSIGQRSQSLGSQVFTINEDVEAGEVEEFDLDITPPAGTTSITATVVCADK